MAVYSVMYTMLALLLVQRLTHATTIFFAQIRTGCHTHNGCPGDMACKSDECIDPCEHGACGLNTKCHMRDHTAYCSCKEGYVGNALEPIGCSLPRKDEKEKVDVTTSATPQETVKKTFNLYYNAKMSWFDARDRCVARGMRLATIHGEKGNNKIAELIREANLPKNVKSHWWLGGNDLDQEGNYTWVVSNTSLTYNNFYPGQPDNYVYEKRHKEHCMELRAEFDFTWNDFICAVPQFYICEQLL